MIGHLLKIVWNRKRANALILAEIFISFLVVFVLFSASLTLLDGYRQPLGYDYEQVWSIAVQRNAGRVTGTWSAEDALTFRRLLDELRALGPVVAAAGSSTGPYFSSVWTTSWEDQGRTLRTEEAAAMDGLAEVLGIRVIEGRWFGAEDDSTAHLPVVINRRFSQEIFGDDSPIGRSIRAPSDDQAQSWEVVGLIDDFRRGGEFARPGNFLFRRVTAAAAERPLYLIQIRVRPGVSADFEETMVERLQTIAQGWNFRVTELEQRRATHLKTLLIPLGVGALVAGFLLLMVVLGLTGVLWQNVTRRTREIGLRRASGATRSQVHRQIVGEVMITAGLGVALGAFVALQAALLGPFEFVPFVVVLEALGLALIFMIALAAACGLYPGWSATRIHPAQALHYE